METSTTTIEELLNAAALSDTDFLAVCQPGVYNPITQENGDTRRLTVQKLIEHILQRTNLSDLINNGSGNGGNAENLGEILVRKEDLPFFASSSPFLIASGKRTLTLKAGTKINFGSEIFFPRQDIELDLQDILDTGGSIANGKDYYLHLIRGGDNLDIRSTLTKAAPEGLSPVNAKLIGGLHTLCIGVGNSLTYVEGGDTKPHPLCGYLAADILPHSVWCLNFRPYSEPEGMTYITALDFWCDIYLGTLVSGIIKSVYQGGMLRNTQYVDFVEHYFVQKKELLDDAEFAAAMLGSNEQTNILGSAFPGDGAGGHLDTAGRRMISIYGVEDGCGLLWQWLRTTSAGGKVGTMYGQTATTPTYGDIAMTASACGPYGQAGGKGSFWGLAGALLAGGAWSDAAGCGSRSRRASYSRSGANSSGGGRGRSRCIRAGL